ncbi:CapA family protein [Marinobacter halodurans]|uniref:CapA family protein n=1 Tax=Marinobacter halodurans TaxID=2528979 RepID=A0ABY1ZKH7_9GAMM|nr:CapA family protein [Marinobacter halodurans]TBW55755.1 CapA family protein [Marinobacter halodurans]
MRLMLCGDVMTGRGIDQIMPQSVDPVLFESFVRSAQDYITLAEQRHGPIPRQVGPEYIWGDALPLIREMAPDVRIANLETAVTTSDDRQPKGIHYRMHPANVACLQAAQLDICTLANNHVLDWGEGGLVETLAVLRDAGIGTAGAGRDLGEASAPTVRPAGRGRVLVCAGGHDSSGIDPAWAAGSHQPGVCLLRDYSPRTTADVRRAIQARRREDDVVVFSVHWGGNWGYSVPEAHRAFAHRLIDEACADIVFGHSSHHPMGVEIYRNKLILYGCGDLINDYEGISGYEAFRPNLRVIYFPELDERGDLQRLDMAVLETGGFTLHRPAEGHVDWLGDRLAVASRAFGPVSIRNSGNGMLELTG